jgi:hypothetical protein
LERKELEAQHTTNGLRVVLGITISGLLKMLPAFPRDWMKAENISKITKLNTSLNKSSIKVCLHFHPTAKFPRIVLSNPVVVFLEEKLWINDLLLSKSVIVVRRANISYV